jgi:hypothetical protein
MPFLFSGLFGRNNNGGNYGQHRRAGPVVYSHSVNGTSDRARAYNTIARIDTTQSNPGESAIPSAGIRAGEIIGHRLWRIIRHEGTDWLGSLANWRLWVPGEPMRGSTREVVARVISSKDFSVREIWGGVYCYATSARLSQEICYWGHWDGTPLVCGTIKTWGDVVEYEEGYRAEFAKVHSLRAVVWGDADLEALRTRYSCR